MIDFSVQPKDAVEKQSNSFKFREKLWDGFIVTTKSFGETSLDVLGYVILGVAMKILFPPFAIPLFVLAGSILATRLVIKLSNLYNLEFVQSVRMKARLLEAKFPYIHVAFFAGALAVSVFSGFVSAIIAAPTGVYTGVIVDMNFSDDRKRRKQSSGFSTHTKGIESITTG